jgi:hypothetical protein
VAAESFSMKDSPDLPYDSWLGSDLSDFMNFKHYLCSQLVTLSNKSPASTVKVESTVNLEEVWIGGAVLESEAAVEEDARVEIRCGTAFFAGRIVQVERHDFGWRFEVEFSPLTPWSPEQFRPLHLLDPAKLDKNTG